MTSAERATVIALESVTRRFGAVTALDQIDLSLIEGEFFALLGPSGCGKTTLLRTLAGFEKPDAGRVVLDGQDITHLKPSRRPVNMMFQSYALFPHMTVTANIAYGLEMEKLSRENIRQRVSAILETTGLVDIATRKPEQLSGGQRQRVALARALVKEPRVLLLDEPLAALDRQLRGQMQLELKRLQHQLGITFVVVTHDQDEALAMADRIAVMNAGVIAQTGTPPELYDTPANAFVAGFVGVSNFISGHYSAGRLDTEQQGAVAIGNPGLLTDGSHAVLSIRPEHISISPVSTDSKSATSDTLKDRERSITAASETRHRREHAFTTSIEGPCVRGRLVDLVYGGDTVRAVVAVPGSPADWVVRLDATHAATAGTPGAEVWCNWAEHHARLLAAPSMERSA